MNNETLQMFQRVIEKPPVDATIYKVTFSSDFVSFKHFTSSYTFFFIDNML